MAPEILRGESSSFASDVYSMGVTFLHILLRGMQPASSIEATLKKVRDQLGKTPLFVQKQHHLERLMSLLSQCTAAQPERRLSAGEVSFETRSLLLNLGGDPRVRETVGLEDDPAYLSFLENAGEKRVYKEGHQSTNTSIESVESSQFATQTTPHSSTESRNHVSSASTYPLCELSQDEAIQLLVHLGCRPNVKYISNSGAEVNGEVLCEYDDLVGYLQELEQNWEKLRAVNLVIVVKKLQAIQKEGVSEQLLKDIRTKVCVNS